MTADDDIPAEAACLQDLELVELFAGELSRERLARWHEHASTCDGCRALLAHAARILAAEREAAGGRPDLSADAPTTDPAVDPQASPVPDVIGRFRVLHRLGQGGMGVVVAAFDEQLQRTVAIKLLRRPGRGADTEARNRMLREARAMARVHHPNVVTIHEVGAHADQVFIVMELVDGVDLDRWSRERARPWSEVVDVWISAGRGLAAIHAHGLVHRDVKPHNVLIDRDGRVLVTDFGLVGPTTAPGSGPAPPDLEAVVDDARTLPGQRVGTPRYMAPEQLAGAIVTAAADQFAYCVALWEALTGRHPLGVDPHARARPDALVPAAPREGKAGPPGLFALLRRGLAREPGERHPSMDALLRELVALRRAPLRRRRAALVVVGLGLAVGLGTQAAALRGGSEVCAEPEGGAFAGAWDPPRRDLVAAHLAALHPPDLVARALAQLDAYGEGWRAARREACEATRVRGEVSTDLLDLRMACLDVRRAAFLGTLDVLEHHEARDPLQLVYGLPSPEPCRNLQGLAAESERPRDATAARRIVELEQRLAVAKVLRLAGQSERARQELGDIVAEAESIAWAPLYTRALLAWALVEGDTDPAAALQTWRRAFVAAARAGPAAAFQAAIDGVEAHLRVNELEPAEMFVQLAEATAAELGGEPFPGDLANNRAKLAMLRNDLPLAETHLRAAIAAAESHADRRTASVNYYTNLVAVVAGQERLDESLELAARALVLARELYGESHPTTLRLQVNTANVELEAGRYREAARTAESAIVQWRALARPLDQAVALGLHARAMRALAEPAMCRRSAEQALALREAALTANDPQVVRSLDILAGCLVDLGERAEALRILDDASARLGADPVDPGLAESLRDTRARATAPPAD